ncbi:hypothetical protein BD309DRAFT_430140 [Dichomitus squalens]|nr:hypothetical protein BD309DRAFT_430140 [Dichomitus squalens]
MATAKPATTPLPRLTACTAGWLRGACFPPICCGRRARGRTRSLCIVQWRTGSVCEEPSCQARGARFCVCSGACNPTAEWDQPFQPTQQSYIPTRHQDDLLALIYLLVSLRPVIATTRSSISPKPYVARRISGFKNVNPEVCRR